MAPIRMQRMQGTGVHYARRECQWLDHTPGHRGQARQGQMARQSQQLAASWQQLLRARVLVLVVPVQPGSAAVQRLHQGGKRCCAGGGKGAQRTLVDALSISDDSELGTLLAIS
jgi:hypothetical protein